MLRLKLVLEERMFKERVGEIRKGLKILQPDYRHVVIFSLPSVIRREEYDLFLRGWTPPKERVKAFEVVLRKAYYREQRIGGDMLKRIPLGKDLAERVEELHVFESHIKRLEQVYSIIEGLDDEEEE